MKDYIRINKADNVAVVLTSGGLTRGTRVVIDDENVILNDDVPQGHKAAIKAISRGDAVIKYGFRIGHATKDIKPGDWVHSHNLASSLNNNESIVHVPHMARKAEVEKPIMVNGYLRRDGRMGVRNELWIIPTVGCVNSQALTIAERLRATNAGHGIDDIRTFTHPYGCSQLGADHENTRKALAALARHPNAGGVIILGLGCENNRLEQLREAMGDFDAARVGFIVAQQCDNEIEEGVKLGRQLLDVMKQDKRRPLPVSLLRVGLKCGGSDGLSGITANPLVGRFSDWLISHGGTTALTEIPEMFGAETALLEKIPDSETFNKLLNVINNFKDYYRSNNQPISENPSPGNKDGGITTLEEKSLGCVQKGGSEAVVDALEYAAPIVTNGLNVVNAPGNDLVASTALALAGCQLVLFTTGRGTPFGTAVPTLKISTNSTLYRRKSNWIDFDASRVLTENPNRVLDDFINKVIDTVNGSPTKNEMAGAKEIAIFKTGVTL